MNYSEHYRRKIRKIDEMLDDQSKITSKFKNDTEEYKASLKQEIDLLEMRKELLEKFSVTLERKTKLSMDNEDLKNNMYRELASKLGIDTSLPIEKIMGELENIILSEEEIKKFQDVLDNMENYLNTEIETIKNQPIGGYIDIDYLKEKDLKTNITSKFDITNNQQQKVHDFVKALNVLPKTLDLRFSLDGGKTWSSKSVKFDLMELISEIYFK